MISSASVGRLGGFFRVRPAICEFSRSAKNACPGHRLDDGHRHFIRQPSSNCNDKRRHFEKNFHVPFPTNAGRMDGPAGETARAACLWLLRIDPHKTPLDEIRAGVVKRILAIRQASAAARQ